MTRESDGAVTVDARCEAVYARAAQAAREIDAYAEHDHVECDLPAVRRALERIRREGLARGDAFCDWGFGTGSVMMLAAALSFDVHGFEIDPRMVAIAHRMADDLGYEANFVADTFLRPGDEDLVTDTRYVAPVTSAIGDEELGFEASDCDVVFAYMWPDEVHVADALFTRHASRGALLVTQHGDDHVLVQRHTGDGLETVIPT